MARTTKEDRKTRIPLGAPRQKLTIANPPEGKVLRWVNDDPGRISAAKAAGYEFVNQDGTIAMGDGVNTNQAIDTRFSRDAVKVDERGQPVRAYLMAIDKELYDQDQAEKQKPIDEVENAIKHGQHATGDLGNHAYIPSEGIRIKRE